MQALPFFLWQVRVIETCDGAAKDMGVERRDVGRWSQRADEVVAFQSSVDGALYNVIITDDGIANFTHGGRNYVFRKKP